MSRLSEKEILQMQSSNLFIIEKMVSNKVATLEEIGNALPVFLHVNDASGPIKYINPKGTEWIDLPLGHIISMEYNFILKHVHPDTIKSIKPQFMDFFLKGDDSSLLTYFQKIKVQKEEEYDSYFTVSKIYRQEIGILSMTHYASSFDSVSSKLARILNEEAFIRKHHIKFSLLTKREKQLIKMITEGLNNREIAEILCISRSTVEQHRKNINAKLETKSFAQLFQYAYAFNLVKF